MIIEAVGTVFCVFALSRVILRFREGRLGWGMTIMWSLAWVLTIAFILSPRSFEPISRAIGIQRPLDLMLIAGLMASYYMTFRVYIYLEELRCELSLVVRELALRERKKK